MDHLESHLVVQSSRKKRGDVSREKKVALALDIFSGVRDLGAPV